MRLNWRFCQLMSGGAVATMTFSVVTSHSVAAVLADELSRAVFALDTDGSICLVNAAFETLIE